MLRQGDFLFIPVSEEQWRNARVSPEDRPYAKKLVVGVGEKTGHMHVVLSRAAETFVGGGARFLRATEDVSVTHEEHAALKIPKGTYQIVQQRELQPDRRTSFVAD